VYRLAKFIPWEVRRRMHFTRTPLKEKIAHTVYRLEAQLSKLEQTSSKLQQRDKEMFERCIGARGANDEAHAIIYANECVEIRTMAKIVLCSELALERVILRLQTVEEVGDLLVHMAPIVGIVRETKGKLTGILPEVSLELEDINTMLGKTLLETGEASVKDFSLDATSQEAKKVLDEATAIAEQKMSESFPELPIPLPVPEKKVALQEAVALSATPTPIERALQPVELEKQVYEYLKKCAGEISLPKCSADLNISLGNVKKVVTKLEEDGKIRLE
jgi:division protein CdvB (Snf7/Vps24/ESCRT-III family)